jgi:hypothetical protein
MWIQVVSMIGPFSSVLAGVLRAFLHFAKLKFFRGARIGIQAVTQKLTLTSAHLSLLSSS